MSLFRTLDRTSAVSNTIHARPLLTFLCPVLQKKASRRGFSKSAISIAPQLAHSNQYVEAWFIKALARAASCREHAKHISTLNGVVPHTHKIQKIRYKSTWPIAGKDDDGEQTVRTGLRPLRKVRQFAKKELRALVDYYGIELDTRPEEEVPDGGALIWNVGDTHEPWPLKHLRDGLHILRLEKLLKDDEASHDKVFDTYNELPSPGVVYLRLDTIRALLHHLAIVERPSPLAMQRFLSILDDMKQAHIHIITSEWTSAIHLTGRAMGNVSAHDLQSALYVWRDMEHRAGIKSSFVTLNVLFNVAVRAENYSLAETFLKELQARRLPLHRHFRISVIYYYGVMKNGNMVRRTYQDLVNAGEIVDTIVMNAVIAALIRAGEPAAAEHVFERMKRLHASKSVAAPGHKFFNRTWRDRRELGLHFTHEGRRLNKTKDEEALKQLQDYAPMAPDARTYGLLIRHQAVTTGNIDRVNELLQEMRHNSVQLEGTIFIVIFRGFAHFGGVRYSSWTRDRLERIWTQYLQALQQSLERTWISLMSVIAVLKAFAKCTDPDRTLQAWKDIRKLWHPTEEELENVMEMLRRLIPQQGENFFDEQRPLG
ncbi:hypothetical protein GQ44DRAFT_823612 [Phaeosphaeriaceae sp. PMI808]|nr:hypothetical protein GQ44DRAFT_823612 [Phaeosphaeriaceae sp. PMI808]